MREVSAFGTPTVVHFCAVLFISAVLSAPWHRLGSAGLAIGICGAAGLLYALVVIRRARRQTGYQPVLEDWIWHTTLPLLAYGALLITALLLHRHPQGSLFVIAAAAVLLLYIGIHNSWDTVTYIAVEQRRSGVFSGHRSVWATSKCGWTRPLSRAGKLVVLLEQAKAKVR